MKRDLISIPDFSAGEIEHLLERARLLKRSRRSQALAGKTLLLVFQKPSLRTRISFELAAQEMGGRSFYLSPEEVGLGQREAVRDVARVLSRYGDAIAARTFDHAHAVELAQESSVPVINALSDEEHPCQALADFLTMLEKRGSLSGARLAYVGDGNNVLHSLALGAGLLGIHLRAATPRGYEPDAKVWKRVLGFARKSGGTLSLTDKPEAAVRDADFIYTDVWASMGNESEAAQRAKAFRGFQVNEALVAKAPKGVWVMHCLPAHRGLEITHGVIDSRRSIVYDQAENRLHVQKAVLEFLLGAGR